MQTTKEEFLSTVKRLRMFIDTLPTPVSEVRQKINDSYREALAIIEPLEERVKANPDCELTQDNWGYTFEGVSCSPTEARAVSLMGCLVYHMVTLPGLKRD